MIYVLNSKGEPLMPTVRHGRVRHLLRDKKAFIVNYHPFTVNKGAKYLNSGSSVRYYDSRIRLFDKVRINSQIGFIYGRRQSGSYLVKDIDGNIISSGISYKKLNFIEKRKGWIVDFKQS